MDKKLSNFLEKREHTILTDIDVITAAVAVPSIRNRWGRSHSLYCAQ